MNPHLSENTNHFEVTPDEFHLHLTQIHYPGNQKQSKDWNIMDSDQKNSPPHQNPKKQE